MRVIAVIRDGVISSPEGVSISGRSAVSQSRAVAIPDGTHERPVQIKIDGIGEIAALLARAAKIAQGLDKHDQMRARELFAAATSLLHASTRLETADQQRFNSALLIA